MAAEERVGLTQPPRDTALRVLTRKLEEGTVEFRKDEGALEAQEELTRLERYDESLHHVEKLWAVVLRKKVKSSGVIAVHVRQGKLWVGRKGKNGKDKGETHTKRFLGMDRRRETGSSGCGA